MCDNDHDLTRLWHDLLNTNTYMYGRVGEASWAIARLSDPQSRTIVFQVVFKDTEDRTIVSNFDVFRKIVDDTLENQYNIGQYEPKD
jgi:hypothetical protein